MYEKNTSFPLFETLVLTASGDAVTSGATYLYSLDGGVAIAGGGAVTHLGDGLWRVVPLPSETDGKTVCIILQATGAISRSIHVGLWDAAISTRIITMAGSNDESLDTVIDSISDGFQGIPSTSQIAAAVDVALIQAGDGADLIQAIADQIAQDWVAGDASPAAVLATIEASASYQTLIANAAAIRNDTENGVALSDQAMDAIADAENAADNAGQVAQVAAQTAGNIYAIVNNATHGNPALKATIDGKPSLEQITVAASVSVEPTKVAANYTWTLSRRRQSTRSSDTINVGQGYTGPLAFSYGKALNPNAVIGTPTSVTIDDSADLVSNLRKSADGEQAIFDVAIPDVYPKGIYEVRMVVTTTDSVTLPLTGTLEIN